MKGLSDETLSEVEHAAREGAKRIREYFSYEGDNPKFYQKAKLGGVAMSAHSRVLQTQTNRAAIAIAISKALELGGDATLEVVKELGALPASLGGK